MAAYRSFITKTFGSYANSINRIKAFTKNSFKFNTTNAQSLNNAALKVEVSAKSGNKIVGYWLAGCSAMVAGAVVLGGVTRLTESGLSMVDWRLIKDMVPPKSEQEWIQEFEKYKQYPEWKYSNKHREMSLSDFKFIYYMEWGHRMWGRAIGLIFFIPAAVFWRKGFFNSTMKKRIIALGSLLGFQGFLGWYMVKSGLDEPKKSTDMPRVSHYRLAAHLGSAFLLYTGMLWAALECIFKPQSASAIDTKVLVKASKRSHHLMALIFTTAMFGAFVAGLDAGLVYNSFPKMGDRWIPSDLLALEPKWTNIFENPTTVQFEHRILGTLTLASICLFAYKMRAVPLPSRSRLALNALVAMSFIQVTLGICTLLFYVPTHLAATHQFGSLSLLSFAIWLSNELKRIPKV